MTTRATRLALRVLDRYPDRVSEEEQKHHRAQLARRLKDRRESQGLSVRALARAAEVPESTVRTYERGAVAAGVEPLADLARALQCPAGWLAFGG